MITGAYAVERGEIAHYIINLKIADLRANGAIRFVELALAAPGQDFLRTFCRHGTTGFEA